MDDLFTLSANPDPKHGLGFLPSDLEDFQFPTLCEDLEQDQLLALDHPQSFYLAFPDAGVFGTGNEAISRASSAVTPQSECSTRTSLSVKNTSPTSEFPTFRDKPTPHDMEAMYHGTTRSIVSGRQSRATSVTWPPTGISQTGLNSTLTPPARTTSHRPQSFSYRSPRISQAGSTTPPPPSSFFPSPSLQPQSANRSPFLSPSMHSPLIPQMPQQSLPVQASYLQANLTPNPSSYYAQPQSHPATSQILQQQFQQGPNLVLQQQIQQQQIQQAVLALHQPNPQRRSLPPQMQAQAQMVATNNFFSPSNATTGLGLSANYLSTSNNNPSQSMSTTSPQPTLPNTTGNSSTGYQCFSHGCGGRHFSNWGNLVRHHRERQLRSKAGAKPACPRCGKGFTRSSARDAHVAGLKCVLGRRRRQQQQASSQSSQQGTTADAATASNNDNAGDAQTREDGPTDGEAKSNLAEAGAATGEMQARREGGRASISQGDLDLDLDMSQDDESASEEGSRDDMGEDEDYEDYEDKESHDLEQLGSTSFDITSHSEDMSFMSEVDDALGLPVHVGDAGRSYLTPQHLHFGH